jgi:hypothetical protein
VLRLIADQLGVGEALSADRLDDSEETRLIVPFPFVIADVRSQRTGNGGNELQRRNSKDAEKWTLNLRFSEVLSARGPLTLMSTAQARLFIPTADR